MRLVILVGSNVQSDEENLVGEQPPMAQVRRVPIAKLIAASLLEQEASLLSPSSLDLRNQADALLATHVIEQVKVRLRKIASKLRKP